MSTKTMTTLLGVDDDPLGDVVLESEMTFGVRAATLAGNAPGLTGSDDWWDMSTTNITCSLTFVAPD
jgi:hypothetical protein